MFSFSIILQLCTLMLLTFLIIATPLPLATQDSRLSTTPVDWTGYQYDDADLGTYSFAYDIEDPVTDNLQYRNEERYANGSVTGSYGYLQPDGNVHVVEYVVDQYGYRARVRILARGQLKPVPVSDTTVHYDVNSDIEAANSNNPWRRSPGFHHHKQQNHARPRPVVAYPKAAVATGVVPTVAYVPPAPTVPSFMFDINGQREHIALSGGEVVAGQHPSEILEILPGFVTINQGVHEPPTLVYLRK